MCANYENGVTHCKNVRNNCYQAKRARLLKKYKLELKGEHGNEFSAS
ncbi:hypothetical protein NCCP2331_29270 [Sporosarcina sp. NCCP-2331]|nr:hypothetical protein NCCP2331_29270 [Sporosarcina sp. NCCP-2331]GLB57043.1 hypothetical protein NCCP2378_28300 [Sporosarcina sp. NCCP-2378]